MDVDQPLQLLRRCLPWLRDALHGIVECDSNMALDDFGEGVPMPGTMGDWAESEARQIIALIRDIEALAGRDWPQPGPEWLDDAIDGRGGWAHLVEETA